MSTPLKQNFKVYQGSTFSPIFRWESATKVYKTITGITKAAPCVVTAVAHVVPDGWRVKVTNAGGMTQINSTTAYKTATLKTVDTVEFNAVNSLDYTTYTSGGVLEYNEPVNLSGYTAKMQIRASLASTTVLLELTDANGKITLNNTTKTISILITATETAAFTFRTAVYSLELTSSSGIVTQLATGTLTLVKEVTR